MSFPRQSGASLIAQLVKNLPAMQETRVQFLGREDPLEKEWQPTPVFLPGESYGQRSLVGYSPWGHKRLGMAEYQIIAPGDEDTICKGKQDLSRNNSVSSPDG